jgi:hypothetical protein
MFVAETEEQAESSSEQELTLCDGTSYYVRVEWTEGGSEEDFDVEVREEVDGGSQEIASESGIDDEATIPQSETLLVNTTPYANALDGGKHSIYGRARRVGLSWSPQTNNDNNKCTVYHFDGLTRLVQKEAGVWRSVDTAVCKGDSVQFKAIPNPIELEDEDFPAGYPEWGDEADGKEGNPVTVTFDELGTKTVSVQACGTNTQLSVYVKEALFFEDTSQNYGFDDFSNADEPWKSVKLNAEDTAKAKTIKTPVTDLFFNSSDDTDVELTEPDPPRASGSPETIKFKGLVDNGESDIEANWGSVGGTNLAKMQARVYAPPASPKTLRVRMVQRDSSDSFNWPFNRTQLEGYLNGDVFDQCVVSFDVSFNYAVLEEDYDDNSDDALTLDSTEDASIIAEAEAGYDFYLFIVSEIKDSSGDVCNGFASGSQYAFLYCCGYYPQSTAAHELGHLLGLNDIEDKYEDDENLMSWHRDKAARNRLRKTQWNTCNP